MTESKLQQDIYNWFNNTYCLKFHEPRLIIHSTPNGGYRNKMEAMTMKATGLLAGVADLTIKLPNSIFIDVEVKTQVGKQSNSQIEYEQRIKKLNGNYIVVRSLEEFKEKIIPLIDKYIK